MHVCMYTFFSCHFEQKHNRLDVFCFCFSRIDSHLVCTNEIATLFHRFNLQFDYMTWTQTNQFRVYHIIDSAVCLWLETFSWTCLFYDNRFHKVIKIHVNMFFLSLSLNLIFSSIFGMLYIGVRPLYHRYLESEHIFRTKMEKKEEKKTNFKCWRYLKHSKHFGVLGDQCCMINDDGTVCVCVCASVGHNIFYWIVRILDALSCFVESLLYCGKKAKWLI